MAGLVTEVALALGGFRVIPKCVVEPWLPVKLAGKLLD